MRFVSIDPSMSNTAIVWGNIDGNKVMPIGWEVVSSKKDKKESVAIDSINRAREVIKTIQEKIEYFNPQICFGESPNGSKSSSAMRGYGMSCCFLALLPNPVFVTPFDVKKFVNGTNSASKDDVMKLAEELFPDFNFERSKDNKLIKTRMEHVCDALIIACSGLKKLNK